MLCVRGGHRPHVSREATGAIVATSSSRLTWSACLRRTSEAAPLVTVMPTQRPTPPGLAGLHGTLGCLVKSGLRLAGAYQQAQRPGAETVPWCPPASLGGPQSHLLSAGPR